MNKSQCEAEGAEDVAGSDPMAAAERLLSAKMFISSDKIATRYSSLATVVKVQREMMHDMTRAEQQEINLVRGHNDLSEISSLSAHLEYRGGPVEEDGVPERADDRERERRAEE